MDAESEYEINRARDAVQTIQTIQSMIDVSADRLEGLRTQCSTSAELTQQEIRTLEGKLVKHFSRQLVIKARFGDELQRELRDVPRLPQWLRVVGLCPESIETICSRVPSLEALRERSERELRALLATGREDEARRLCGAMLRLRTYTEALARGENSTDMQLYWDSWERHGHARASPRTRPRHRGSVPGDDLLASPLNAKGVVRGPTTPVSRRKDSAQTSLPAPAPGAPLTKSRSHESQLCVRAEDDLSDNSQSSTLGTGGGPESTPPSSPPREPDTPHHKPHINNTNVSVTAPRSPRTPTVNPCMTHDIAHRFTKTFNMIATCDYCDKQMLFGSGLKCKECKFKCHRDCESKVPPSCGLPPEFVSVFRERFQKDGMHNHGGAYPSPTGMGSPMDPRTCVSNAGKLSSLTQRRRHWPHTHAHSHLPANAPPNALAGGGPDSSSNTSSCNSSTPSSPALAPPAPATPHPPPTTTKHQQFHFPDVKTPPISSPSVAAPRVPPPPALNNASDNKDLTSSVKSDSSRCVSLSGSASTDSERAARADSLDDANNVADSRWPRQNSLSMKEWDIPYDELKLFDVIGAGRFGTVYRGSWHGAVAVKLLHVQDLGDESGVLDSFKHEVATFRKTRHENLVLFMGACMKPPKLAIVTSLCKGCTLYSLLHQRRDKFNPNKSVLVAQQISQGMGYLHARGIIHKDLKTKNIFLENGKVVITDFGLFSVTKLCFGNNLRGDSLGIPAGWLCYLAPELVRALRPHASVQLPFSKASDVYAFGTVWYELLCGEWPFRGQPAEAVIWQVGRGVKQSLADLQASRDTKDILMLCWSYKPSERPDFAHLLSTLEKLPRKRLARSPSHPVHLSRSAESVF